MAAPTTGLQGTVRSASLRSGLECRRHAVLGVGVPEASGPQLLLKEIPQPEMFHSSGSVQGLLLSVYRNNLLEAQAESSDGGPHEGPERSGS